MIEPRVLAICNNNPRIANELEGYFATFWKINFSTGPDTDGRALFDRDTLPTFGFFPTVGFW